MKRLTDQQRDTLDFYSRPEIFGPEFSVGTEVTGAFATAFEGQTGRILCFTPKRDAAAVRFETETRDVCPCDVYLKD